ncbi:XRE family transcriptional regulator [Actinorhabdospora filicis]|uniref:XRE family transcriptional regulator n=1 Tax=Actinorhabdospora filicis TaxID=1785913 RepID=A0A9W6SPK7_9ACTN|nr:BTAD domain-containing putative transcriptional regulator [Actinorhabdospora filicis]GLZ80028.1 XRE family transcriptional regulator [Actinorhabdospora filicis]
MPVRVIVLGPTELHRDGVPIDLGGTRPRAVLTVLARSAGRVVGRDEIIAHTWGHAPPRTAVNQVQIAVHRLRKALTAAGLDAATALRRQGGGYVLDVGTDLAEFRAHLGAGRAAAARCQWRAARDAFDAAAGLWRPGGELAEDHFTARLHRMVAALHTGGHAETAREAAALLDGHPLRERVWYLLVLAHIAAGEHGRAAEALRRARATLAEALGIDPGRELRSLDGLTEPAAGLAHAATWITGAPAAPVARPMGLPAEPREFVGRDGELREILAALGEHGAVAVTGLGGVGKTALATRAARAADAPGGCLFTDLRGADDQPRAAHDVMGSLLRSLGITDGAVPDDPPARAELYHRALTGRGVLLVLDNAAGPEQIEPLLSREVPVIVTARRALTGLPHVHLDALPADDATTLLSRLSGRPQDDDLRDLAALAGRLPLALRVVGARLALRRGLDPGRMVARLTDEHARLDALSDGDRRVRSCIEFGYRLLSPSAAAALRAVARLPVAEFGHWVLTALAGDATPAITAELTAAQLLRPAPPTRGGGPRHRLHDLVRVYAATEPDPDATGRLHAVCAALLSLAHAADDHLPYARHATPERPPGLPAPDPGALTALAADPMGWFAAERDLLLTAPGIAAEIGDADLTRRLATVVTNYLELHGHGDALDTVLAHARRLAHDAEGDAALRFTTTKRLRLDGRFTETVPVLRALRRDHLRLGDPLRAAAAATDLAVALRQAGAPQAVREAHLRWALTTLDGLPGELARAQRGWTTIILGNTIAPTDPAGSERAYATALRVFRAGRDRVGEATALAMLGAVHHRRGDHDRAIALYQRAHDLHAALEDDPGRRFAALYIVTGLLAAGRLVEAATRADALLAELVTAPMPALDAGALRVRGAIHLRAGELAAATGPLTRSLALSAGMPDVEARTARVLLAVHEAAGDAEAARAVRDRLYALVPEGHPLRSREGLDMALDVVF